MDNGGLSAIGYRLSIVGLFGGTAIFGPDRDALGFDRFFEAGLGLEADVSSRDWKVSSLHFGLKAIFGADVRAWGLICGYGFISEMPVSRVVH